MATATGASQFHYRQKNDPLSSHQQILRTVRSLNQSPVLDVGSAQGVLGQGLSGSGIILDAIEPKARWAEVARPYYRNVMVSTVEEAGLPHGEYRTVVCGDVLEHVVDPVSTLKKLVESAVPDATFVISLPNVAHLSTRLLLLAGQWPQMERGILDKTHLHFYTKSTATRMLNEAGLSVKSIRATAVPVEQLSSSRLINSVAGAVQRVLIALLPKLFAFQWTFVAEPSR